jgi:hypothetical protein
VFEQGLFGYKFMALAVMLILLDAVRGQIRGGLLVWLALLTVAFNPVPMGLDYNAKPWAVGAAAAVTVNVVVLGALALVWCIVNRRVPPWYLLAALVIVLLAFAHLPPWAMHNYRHAVPKWIWQLVLVPSGFALAMGPLWRTRRPQMDQMPSVNADFPALTGSV